MKRIRTIKFQDRISRTEIIVKINIQPGCFTRDEVESASEELCEGIMKVLNNARYFSAPLTQIKVQ